MNNILFDKFLKLVQGLNEREIKYCIVGGLALNLLGISRYTEDIDIFISSDRENIYKLINFLREFFKDEVLEELTVSSFERYPVIRYGTQDGFYIDLITALGEEINWKTIERNLQEVMLENITIPIPTLEYMIKLKEGASLFREKDKVDLIYLKKLRQKSREQRIS